MHSGEGPRVFVSFSKFDEPIASKIAAALRDAGLRTWLYVENGLPGIPYTRQVTDAISQSRTMVVVISAEAARSEQVYNEVLQAMEDGIPRLPVLRGMTHADLIAAHPDWRRLIGAAVSIQMPDDCADRVMDRIVEGARAAAGAAADSPAPPLAVPARVTPELRRPFWFVRFWKQITISLALLAAVTAFLTNATQLMRFWRTPVPHGPPNSTQPAASTKEAPGDIRPPTAQSGDKVRLASAVRVDDEQAIRELLKVVVASDVPLDGGWTLLHLAARHGAARAVSLLIGAGVAVDAVDNQQLTALHLACTYNHAQVVKLLLKSDARIDLEQSRGDLALHLVADREDAGEVIKLLTGAGLDVDSHNLRGETALHVAARAHRRGNCELLIELGADVNAKSGFGETPLVAAVLAVQISAEQTAACEIIRLLKLSKADTTIATPDGQTAAAIARQKGWDLILECLKQE